MDIFREEDGIAAIGHRQHDLMHIAALLVKQHIVAVEVVFQNFAVFAVGVEADQLMAMDHVLYIDVLAMNFWPLGLLGAGGDLVDLEDQLVAVDGVFAVVHLADIGGAQDVQRLADDGGIGGFGLFGVDVAVNHGGSLLIWL